MLFHRVCCSALHRYVVPMVPVSVAVCVVLGQAGFTEHNRFVSAVKMLVIGGLTAAAAYLIGWGLGEALGVVSC